MSEGWFERFLEVSMPYFAAIGILAAFTCWIWYGNAQNQKEEMAILYRKMEAMEFVARIPVYPSFESQKHKLSLNTSANGFQVMIPGNLVTAQTIDLKTLDDVIDYFKKLPSK